MYFNDDAVNKVSPLFKTQISVKNRFSIFHLTLKPDSIYTFAENFIYSINKSRNAVFSCLYGINQRSKIKIIYLFTGCRKAVNSQRRGVCKIFWCG